MVSPPPPGESAGALTSGPLVPAQEPLAEGPADALEEIPVAVQPTMELETVSVEDRQSRLTSFPPHSHLAHPSVLPRVVRPLLTMRHLQARRSRRGI